MGNKSRNKCKHKTSLKLQSIPFFLGFHVFLFLFHAVDD